MKCEDCKHWFDNGTNLSSCDRDALLRERDFFCAAWERKKPFERPYTNADRIRAMSVEKLANQLVSEQYVAMKMVLTLLCQKLKDEEILDENDAKELFCNFENEAKKRWGDMLKEKLDWLKAPAEEGER